MRTLHIGLRVADLDRSLAFYRAVGYEVVGSTPEQMRAMIDTEVKIMHPIVHASGAKPE